MILEVDDFRRSKQVGQENNRIFDGQTDAR